ncbi:hypothetical protein ETAA8_36490 [Anatilimnocola aggregata]|uniref:DUF6881 domain-containing protein n=1 Tax=Anatilimnocola aggregata TaxID=2528021 RepID=A0A517YEA3_9BACT|nr:hypothetical protein ETAA8_36490 [Anatilimnocola aggregata]
MTTTYICVQWIHRHSDYPVQLYSELDEHRFEVRKVEVSRDGRMSFAGERSQSGDTRLTTEPIPSFAEIASDKHFSPREISVAEFEAVWSAAINQL